MLQQQTPLHLEPMRGQLLGTHVEHCYTTVGQKDPKPEINKIHILNALEKNEEPFFFSAKLYILCNGNPLLQTQLSYC